MGEVFIAADNIISPLGFTTDENFNNLKKGISGVTLNSDTQLSQVPFFTSVIDTDKLNSEFEKLAYNADYTRFEKLLILSISDALVESAVDITDKRTLIVISTTKGNIDLLEDRNASIFDKDRVHLWSSASVVQRYFNNPNTPLVVSNACISGSLAIIIGARMIDQRFYDNVVVCGADIISEFVVSGFQSFMALGDSQCKPYDKDRNGLNLGEGSATVILTNDKSVLNGENSIRYVAGASSNDANHISGPSRTGDGLLLSIQDVLCASGLSSTEMNFVSAHGTATIYNDEMESKAFKSASLHEVPINSFKGYYGHTLGAAGTLESVLTIKCMRENMLIGTAGYKTLGVTEKLNVIEKARSNELTHCLKTASGFGGCNASVIFSKS